MRLRTVIAIALGIVFGYAAHEASAYQYTLAQPFDDDGPALTFPQDGRTYSWQRWDLGTGTYTWGTSEMHPDGYYNLWDFSTGKHSMGWVQRDNGGAGW